MNTSERLDVWVAEGKITPAEHAAVSMLVQKQRVSLWLELNALLYLGVLAVAGGTAWTAEVYAGSWGDAAILVPSTLLLTGCLWYCFSHAPAFSTGYVEAPGLAFDYLLYLACLVIAVELGYVEHRFHLLRERWDFYLLLSAAGYFWLAYRFDNRFALSLAIATLGGWFGVRVSRLDLFVAEHLRITALAYGGLVALIGVALNRAGLKRHFLESYLHVATNVILAAMVSAVMMSERPSLWIAAVLAAAAVSIAEGVHYRRFAFVVYGVGYAYLAFIREVLRQVSGATDALAAILVSAILVVVGLIALSRRVGRDR